RGSPIPVARRFLRFGSLRIRAPPPQRLRARWPSRDPIRHLSRSRSSPGVFAWILLSSHGCYLSVFGRGVHVAKETTASRITAVDRAVAVLETFRNGQDLTQAEIGRAAGLSEATTFRYLTTLTRHGLVERNETSGRYSLGLRLFQLGEHALGAD